MYMTIYVIDSISYAGYTISMHMVMYLLIAHSYLTNIAVNQLVDGLPCS